MSTVDVRAIDQKITRISNGAQLRVLDLFSGCGGISLRFHATDFEITAAIEFDPDAAKSHGQNFHPGKPEHARDARDLLGRIEDDSAYIVIPSVKRILDSQSIWNTAGRRWNTVQVVAEVLKKLAQRPMAGGGRAITRLLSRFR